MNARPVLAALPVMVRSDLETHLPRFLQVTWYDGLEEALRTAGQVEIGWYDLAGSSNVFQAASQMRWLFTLAAGLEHLPLDLLRERGVRVTNGSGLNAANVADYAVMGVIVCAKRFDTVIRAHERREWLHEAPGKSELSGTQALIIGYGQIGQAIGARLSACGVAVTGVRSKADPAANVLGPREWQPRLAEFDWVILAAPLTGATKSLIAQEELSRMKTTAWLLNVGRGQLIARDALLQALTGRQIGGAFLDVTDPEPLPADDPLWRQPNAIVTMHLSGRSETALLKRAGELFLRNLERYMAGDRMENEIELQRGY